MADLETEATEKKLPVIERDPVRTNHVLFEGADGKPVTELDMFNRFSCDIPNRSPETPDEVEPDFESERVFFEEDLPIGPGGKQIRMFGFTVPGHEPSFPAPTLRFREGDIVHSSLKAKKNTHTIHHHGIEPSNFNDGVGHTSFEVNSRYTYQFRPSLSGTFLYHCHKNTTLHFEMGMYGFLIVDPPVEGAPFEDGGPGFVRRANDIVGYDVEALWAVDEIDTRWHEVINHKAGISCPFYHSKEVNDFERTGARNPGLHDFNPDVFLISGVAGEGRPIDDPKVAVAAEAGQTVLLRLVNAGYTVQEYSFPNLDVEVIDVDGRPLGLSPKCAFSRPFTIEAGSAFQLTTARRYTMLAKPMLPGNYPFNVKFFHWVSGKKLAEIETFIEVK